MWQFLLPCYCLYMRIFIMYSISISIFLLLLFTVTLNWVDPVLSLFKIHFLDEFFSSLQWPTLLLLLLLSRFRRVRLCATPWTAAHQAPPSLGFSRQEHWSGVPFPSPMHACTLSRFSHVWLCVTPWTAAPQASLSTGFSRQQYRSGLPFPSPMTKVQFSSVAQSCPTLWPHESQHARPPCPSQTPGVYSNTCPLSQWWHPAISSSVVCIFSRWFY